MNYSGEFSKSFHVIYLNQLELKCKDHDSHATFLDLGMIVVDDLYEYKLYDERGNYTFFVVRIPDTH